MNWFGTNKRQENSEKNDLTLALLHCPEHAWIQADSQLLRIMVSFIFDLPQEVLRFINQNKVIFLATNGRYSCSIDLPDSKKVILLFPEILELLKQVNTRKGLAILAHEIGHLYFEHAGKKTHYLSAQLEADHFACKLGYQKEIEEIISSECSGDELSQRLGALNREKRVNRVA